jgi:general secretion pathway protein H
MTVLVSPLTGKADLRKGRWAMPRPRDDTEASERADPGP